MGSSSSCCCVVVVVCCCGGGGGVRNPSFVVVAVVGRRYCRCCCFRNRRHHRRHRCCCGSRLLLLSLCFPYFLFPIELLSWVYFVGLLWGHFFEHIYITFVKIHNVEKKICYKLRSVFSLHKVGLRKHSVSRFQSAQNPQKYF